MTTKYTIRVYEDDTAASVILDILGDGDGQGLRIAVPYATATRLGHDIAEVARAAVSRAADDPIRTNHNATFAVQAAMKQ